MIIIESLKEMQAHSASLRAKGYKIGFVPTMGFLHEGHLSLMKEALSQFDQAVVSIFINPLQFGPAEDFEKYPRDIDGDVRKCQAAGVQTVFLPRRGEIAGKESLTFVVMEKLMGVLCGASRPGHFKGVATIVLKLLNVIQPQGLYLGAKDFQQTVVLKKMVQDFFIPVEVKVLPTVREPDGLAMSSRNSYLSANERRSATVLYRAMIAGEERYHQGVRQGSLLRSIMIEEIMKENNVKIDYLEIIDPETLVPVDWVGPKSVAVLAVWIGKTRLIDNWVFPAIHKN